MRLADRCEIFATSFDDDVDALVADLPECDPIGAVIAAADGIPGRSPRRDRNVARELVGLDVRD